eukprot:362083-Chlamydomonas_euryale.AAC.2
MDRRNSSPGCMRCEHKLGPGCMRCGRSGLPVRDLASAEANARARDGRSTTHAKRAAAGVSGSSCFLCHAESLAWAQV